ncbi:MAG: sodium:proton antiporter [Alphaproteobacteria bacterium]|nr:Na+/H+ antiporter subunit E [Alphaproteobacteria bacterium]TAD90221.1 MAG: sodium:proton antiporter [Alphaproteobacteria bacterium]
MSGWLRVAATFSVELVLSTWATIRAVVAPPERLRPAILAVPLAVRSAPGITLFASMVTLTPGTTSLEVSEDQSTLFVHVLDTDAPDSTIAALKSSLEARTQEVLP